jgi:hypothetical protein
MTAALFEDLLSAAEEELERACTLGWRQLSRCTPWGDVFEGFTPAGLPVTFERNYLWGEGSSRDILVEVVVYESEAYEAGARLVRTIRRSEAER